MCRKDCIICGKEILRGNSILRSKRQENGVTCSKYCARIYARVYEYARSRVVNNRFKFSEEIKI